MRFIELLNEYERTLFLPLIDGKRIGEKVEQQGFRPFDVKLAGVPPIMGSDRYGDIDLTNIGTWSDDVGKVIAALPNEPDITAIRAKWPPTERIILPCSDFPARCSVSDRIARPGGVVDLPPGNGVNGRARRGGEGWA